MAKIHVAYKVTILLIYFAGISCPQSLENVKNLSRDLLSDYDKRHRPVIDQSKPVYVNVSMDIITIQDMDEVSGKFSIEALMYFTWIDQSLVWNPKDYGGTWNLFLPATDIWYPKLALTNPSSSVDDLVPGWSSVRIIFYGLIILLPVNLLQTTCSIDVTYYPFDSQKCDMYFSPLSYGSSEFAIISPTSSILQSYYQEHGEWDIVSTSAASYSISGGDSIVFTFILKRKPKFVIVNILLPIIFMAAINILVFVLPAASGERVGFSVTMLLALAVFLTLVADNLPKTSKPTPILGDYLMAILVLSLLMCVVAIVNLRFFHKPEDSTPPKCCRVFTRFILCRVCERNHKSLDRQVRVTQVQPFKVDDTNKANIQMKEEDDKDKTTWQDFSYVIDGICLVLFVLAECAVNGYYLLILSKGEQNS